jgi:hypothetical protein
MTIKRDPAMTLSEESRRLRAALVLLFGPRGAASIDDALSPLHACNNTKTHARPVRAPNPRGFRVNIA